MNVCIDHVFKPNTAYRLNTLPHRYKRMEEIKHLVGSSFIFKESSPARGGTIFVAPDGTEHLLNPVLFLDHSRFYYESGSGTVTSGKTALMVIRSAILRSTDGKGKIVRATAGTIFANVDRSKSDKTFAIVRASNNKEYKVSSASFTYINDIDQESTIFPDTNTYVDGGVTPVQATEEQEVPSSLCNEEESFEIVETKAYTVKGVVFDSYEKAEGAVAMLKALHARSPTNT